MLTYTQMHRYKQKKKVGLEEDVFSSSEQCILKTLGALLLNAFFTLYLCPFLSFGTLGVLYLKHLPGKTFKGIETGKQSISKFVAQLTSEFVF